MFLGPHFPAALCTSVDWFHCLQVSGQIFNKSFPYSVGNEGTSLAEFLEACDSVPDMLGSPSGLRGMTEAGRQPEWSRPQKIPPSRPSETQAFQAVVSLPGHKGLGSCQGPFNSPALLSPDGIV